LLPYEPQAVPSIYREQAGQSEPQNPEDPKGTNPLGRSYGAPFARPRAHRHVSGSGAFTAVNMIGFVKKR